jgi:hypothetical protein
MLGCDIIQWLCQIVTFIGLLYVKLLHSLIFIHHVALSFVDLGWYVTLRHSSNVMSHYNVH